MAMMDPTPEQLKSVDALDQLMDFSGVTLPLRSSVMEALGDPTSIREISFVSPGDLGSFQGDQLGLCRGVDQARELDPLSGMRGHPRVGGGVGGPLLNPNLYWQPGPEPGHSKQEANHSLLDGGYGDAGSRRLLSLRHRARNPQRAEHILEISR